MPSSNVVLYSVGFANCTANVIVQFVWQPAGASNVHVAPFVAYLCSEAAGTISGKVFGVQGDAVELYQPFTSVAFIQNHDTRWTPEGIAARAHELFDESGVSPEVENMMAKLRFSMTDRSAL